jgi:hypothetical protein
VKKAAKKVMPVIGVTLPYVDGRFVIANVLADGRDDLPGVDDVRLLVRFIDQAVSAWNEEHGHDDKQEESGGG